MHLFCFHEIFPNFCAKIVIVKYPLFPHCRVPCPTVFSQKFRQITLYYKLIWRKKYAYFSFFQTCALNSLLWCEWKPKIFRDINLNGGCFHVKFLELRLWKKIQPDWVPKRRKKHREKKYRKKQQPSPTLATSFSVRSRSATSILCNIFSS